MFAGFPVYFGSEAAAALVRVPPGTTASGKGPFRWLSHGKQHLTPPPFWKELD
jgi:hypothetical protein